MCIISYVHVAEYFGHFCHADDNGRETGREGDGGLVAMAMALALAVAS